MIKDMGKGGKDKNGLKRAGGPQGPHLIFPKSFKLIYFNVSPNEVLNHVAFFNLKCYFDK